MGTDVSSNSGVVFPVAEIAPHLFGKLSRPKVANAVAEIKEIFTAAKNDPEMSNILDDEKALDSVKIGSDIVEWFNHLMRGMLTKSWGEYYFSYDSTLILDEIWHILLGVADLSLPPVTFEYWSNSRLNGWDVPLDTPCVVFDPDDLFETKMNKDGKKLAKMLKRQEILPTTWTTVSS